MSDVPPPTLTDLPEELLVEILAQCDTPRHLSLAASVCKPLFHAHASAEEALWRPLFRALWSEKWEPRFGARRWWICRASSSATSHGERDGELRLRQYRQLALPSRVASTAECELLTELSFRESYRAAVDDCGRVAMVDEELIATQWSVSFSNELVTQQILEYVGVNSGAIALPFVPVFHRDGGHEDPVFYRQGRTESRWELTSMLVRPGGEDDSSDDEFEQPDGATSPGRLASVMRVTGGGVHLIERDEISWGWSLRNNTVQITAKSGVGGVAGSCKRVEGCEAADVKSRPELNGNPCAIEGYDAEAGRYRVRFGDGVTPPRALFGKSAALSSCKVCTSGNKLFNGVVDGVCPACKGSVAIEFFGEVLALKPTNVVLPAGVRVVLRGCVGSAEQKALNGLAGRTLAPPEPGDQGAKGEEGFGGGWGLCAVLLGRRDAGDTHTSAAAAQQAGAEALQAFEGSYAERTVSVNRECAIVDLED